MSMINLRTVIIIYQHSIDVTTITYKFGELTLMTGMAKEGNFNHQIFRVELLVAVALLFNKFHIEAVFKVEGTALWVQFLVLQKFAHFCS